MSLSLRDFLWCGRDCRGKRPKKGCRFGQYSLVTSPLLVAVLRSSYPDPQRDLKIRSPTSHMGNYIRIIYGL